MVVVAPGAVGAPGGQPLPDAAQAFATPSQNAAPVESDIETVAFGSADASAQSRSSDAQTNSDSDDQNASSAVVGHDDLPDLAVIGVNWDSGAAPADLEVEYRVNDGEWSDWESIDVEDPAAFEGLEREGTEPHVLIDAEEIEVRLVSSSLDGEGLDSAELAVIDPGQSPADSEDVPLATPQAESRSASAASGTSANADAEAMSVSTPTINTRAQWGADESIRTWDPQEGDLRGLVIHHTAGTNAYDRSDVPGIIRGIYSYHAEVNGWGDIGYNVLIDRFGRAWEGRYGGIEDPIIGAHALGMNTNTAGLAYMGNTDTANVTSDGFGALAWVGAWKLDLHGLPPTGSITVDGTSYNRVSGHRESSATSCPGANLTSRMGELRTRMGEFQG